jgi:putative ABC transport system substrate-binding protein
MIVRRREFVAMVGGVAAATWSHVASAQQPSAMRRIGVLPSSAESDVELQVRVATFSKELHELGWIEGQNLRTDYRWGTDRYADLAAELVGIRPDVIVAVGTPAVAALQRATQTVPIVFVQVTDPVGAGFVNSLARPGGNITGLAMYEPTMGTKWLQILKEMVPTVARVAVVFNPETAPGRGLIFWRSIEAAASSFAITAIQTPVHSAAEIERGIAAFAHEPNGGMFVMPDVTTLSHRELIVALAARYSIPAIYSQRFFATSGGLISYGASLPELYRRAAGYVDQILKGAKPRDLPVQRPTIFEFVINLKTAKALGITMPQSLLGGADEVIE